MLFQYPQHQQRQQQSPPIYGYIGNNTQHAPDQQHTQWQPQSHDYGEESGRGTAAGDAHKQQHYYSSSSKDNNSGGSW
jgi:hypothetical protein